MIVVTDAHRVSLDAPLLDALGLSAQGGFPMLSTTCCHAWGLGIKGLLRPAGRRVSILTMRTCAVEGSRRVRGEDHLDLCGRVVLPGVLDPGLFLRHENRRREGSPLLLVFGEGLGIRAPGRDEDLGTGPSLIDCLPLE